MQEKILSIIEGKNKAITYEEIMEKLDEEEIEVLSETLVELQKNLKIRFTNKGKYEKFTDKSQKIGTFTHNPKNFGFVMVEGETEDYYIAGNNINGAVDGDTVVISVIDEERHEAVIRHINERNLKDLLVGEFHITKDKNYIDLDDDKLNIIIEIPDGKTKNAVSGHKVVVKVQSTIEKTNYYQGEVIRILGHKDDPGVDILSVAAKYGIIDLFDDKVEAELETIPNQVLKQDYENRKDLRNQTIFTIDGDDTKDIDDAISIEKLENGNYKLGVHIADVSYYVKENTALGDEAYNRGTSSYLANTVIPMLPHQLSNGICSLNPNVERLTISCVMEIDEKGDIITCDIFESVIESKIQMTYKKVNQVLEENIIPEGYDKYADKLKLMYELAKILRKSKVEKGYIDFDIEEPKIITDESGKAIDVQKRVRGAGEKLIEDFMIAANEAVASTIAYMDLPFIYRVHGLPDEEKVSSFLQFTSILGYKVVANIKKLTPKTIQGILDQLHDKKEYTILSAMLLRSMKKAIYDVQNIGHFGLASKFYTHFTSPIRRYPDLTVHRLLRTYLFKHSINNDTITYFNNTLPNIAKHSSERERAAIECEREVADIKMAEYMLEHIGETFKGVISTVTSFGFYVELSNLVEGMVRIDDLGDDYYYYEESTFSLVGKRTHQRYMLGQEVLVTVDSVLKEKGQINFVLAKGDKNGNKQSKSKV